jgi:hypothetical protein
VISHRDQAPLVSVGAPGVESIVVLVVSVDPHNLQAGFAGAAVDVVEPSVLPARPKPEVA